MRRILLLLLLTAIIPAGCKESESRVIRELQIPAVDLSTVEDGRYRGRFTHHKNLYETEVEVSGHRITDITVLHDEGDDYDLAAREVLVRVRAQQSLQVDCVSGATKSSKLYLITMYNALSTEEIDLEALVRETMDKNRKDESVNTP
jgi:uncharacterized protein with FMN-binding domain